MINKRIFGADIPILVKKKLEARQKVAEGGKNPNESINSNYTDETSAGSTVYEYDELINNDFDMQADLSSRTPFIRMWTAVSLVRPIDTTTDEMSSDDYDKLSQEEKQGYKVLSKKIYVIGSHNLSTVDSINESNKTRNTEEEINYALFPSEHGVDKDHNKFMKPQAGITGLSSETGGTLGSIKTTEIKFTVHNFADYDEIYNKYFLRPGAQIFVDFGWNNLKTKLYNPNNYLDNSDGVGIETKLYGEKNTDKKATRDGFVTENAGDVETLIGIVTGYDSKIMENGTIECSIELTSKNSALNFSPKNPTENIETTNAKFEYEIDSLIKFEAVYKLAPKDDRTNILKALRLANSGTSNENQAKFEAFIEELAFNSFGTDNFNPTMLAIDSGIFLVGDDATSSDQFISWGFLEDRILNKYFGHGDDENSINSEDKEKLEIGLDSSKSYTTYQQGFIQKQTEIKSAPSFVVPEYWDKSFSNPLEDEGGKAGESIKEKKDKNLIDSTDVNDIKTNWQNQISKVKYDDESTKSYDGPYPISDFDKESSRVPLREIFINTDIIKKAFTNSDNTTFKSVVNEILEKVNGDSYGIWNWVMAGIGDDNRLSIIDTNQMAISAGKKADKFEKMFVFKVMGKDSIVTSYDVSLEMPAGEIGSMYAIQAMSGTSKKLYPISTMIEKQSALQSLLSRVGEDSSNVRFRYLPDLAPYNALKQDEDKSGIQFKEMYNDSAKILGYPSAAKKGYGGAFNVNETFTTHFKEKTAEDEPNTEDQNDKIIQKNIEALQADGYTVVDSIEDKFKLFITGTYQASGFAKPMPLPMKLTLKIYGISTLKPGDIFKVDYLPQVYLERVYFQVTSVSQQVDSVGWYTTLETQFRIRPDKLDDNNIIGAKTSDELTDVQVDSSGTTQKDKYEQNLNKLVLAPTKAVLPQIDDSLAYRWKKKYPAFTTFADSPKISTYHVPNFSPFKDDEWAALEEATMKCKKKYKAGDGFTIDKGQVITVNRNFESLRPMMNKVQSVSLKGFNNIKILFKFEITHNRPVYIANPMYYWDEGSNRYNGFGYARIFRNNAGRKMSGASDKAIERGYVRGIYLPGEVCWFGVAGNLERHWFVAPTGTNNPISSYAYGSGGDGLSRKDLKSIYDINPFDDDWDFSSTTGEEADESGPTID